MQRTCRIAAFLLLVLWLPATLHCAIEAGFPGDSAGTCCQGDPGAVGDDHCANDSCAAVESNLIAPIGDDLVLATPTAFAGPGDRIAITPETIVPPTISPERTHSPPELARTWQFTARAALAPRAP